MKHDFRVTLFLIMLFFTAQVVGLFLLNQSIEQVSRDEQGNIEVSYSEPVTGRPDLQGQDTFTYTLFMILIGTVILLALIKFRLFKVWKAWFFLAIFGALMISFSVLIPEKYSILFPYDLVLVLSLALAYLKLYRPNVFVHNLTEVFMYGGITIMLAPLFTVFWAVLLLVAISIYDAIAVWKLKHMITLAKAQAEEKMFAGLMIPYSKRDSKDKVVPKSKISIEIPKGVKDGPVKSAILGGGDIAFPMLFAGSVMTWLIQQGLSKGSAFFESLIISLFAGIALFLLLIKGKKDTFYPAMPFITAGCMVGYGVIRMILLL